MINKKTIIILSIFWVFALLPFQLFSTTIIYVFGLLTIIWIYHIFKTIKNKQKWKSLFFLSPIFILFFLGFFSGLYSYINGSGTFLFHNKKSTIVLNSYQDFDSDYRVYYQDFRGKHYGPISFITSAKLFRGKINDLTLKIIINCFGYQFKMYRGKIPTAEEIFEALKDSKTEVSFTYTNHKNVDLFYKGQKYRIEKSTNMVKKNDKALNCNKGNCYVSDAFYPLLIVADEMPGEYNNCIEIQLIDLENKILFTEYSIKKHKKFDNTFCRD
jgi:hypothetical protein